MASEIDSDVRFDHAAANFAIGALRATIADTEGLLANRRRRHAELKHSWEGPAREWYEDRYSALEVVASMVVSDLESTLRALVARQGEATAEQHRRVAARVERARLQREAEAARQRAEDARRAEEARAAERARIAEEARIAESAKNPADSQTKKAA